jgi:hypothetical protein
VTSAPLPHLDYSPLDSARFDRRIYRATLHSVDAIALHAALRRERVDTLILRVPAERIGELAALAEVDLFPIMADTHVSYEIALKKFTPVDHPDVEFVAVNDIEREHLRAIAREIFQGYASHYRANPLLDLSMIADGYADWAARHVGNDATPVWFVRAQGVTVGFAGCLVDRQSDTARGVLNGILPAARGRGNYRAMLHGMLQRFQTAGLQTFSIATQVHNTAVQRVWGAVGLRLVRAENTVHINCGFGSAP